MKIVMQSNKTIGTVFNEFITTKQGENLSQASIDDYENMFGYFMDFYGWEKPAMRYYP